MLKTLSEHERRRIRGYLAAANRLSVFQIHLYDNPLPKHILTKGTSSCRCLNIRTPRLGDSLEPRRKGIHRPRRPQQREVAGARPFDKGVMDARERFHLASDVNN
jgi:hypothetical protein